MVYETLEPIAAFRRRGEPKPVPGRNSVEDVEKCAGRDVVALVDDYESLVGGDLFDACPVGESRRERYIGNAGGFGWAATDLSAFESKMLLQPVAVLISQCFAVNKDQRRGGA
jgi:hypothetical protein